MSPGTQAKKQGNPIIHGTTVMFVRYRRTAPHLVDQCRCPVTCQRFLAGHCYVGRRGQISRGSEAMLTQ